MKMGRGILAVLAFLAVAAPAGAQARAAAEGFRWTGQLAAGKLLEIKGVNGSIEVEPASGQEIEITTEVRSRRSDPSSVSIVRVESAEGLTFCALYPTPRGKADNVCAPGSGGHMSTNRNDVRVDFHVRLPSGPRFRGKTVNGGIDATRLSNDLDVSTVNGQVRVSTTGAAAATTVNGGIDAEVGRFDTRRGLEFSTVNGSIDVDLPDDVDADVDASWINGGLDTDLPLTLGSIGRRAAHGRLGTGGAKLSLSTVNGSIHLR